MKTMKKFLIYALLIAAFWLVSDILIYFAINSTFNSVDTKVYTNSPEIVIEESKATFINGVVKGSIKNNTDSIINNKCLKIDMYSPRNINLGTKYVKIENLQPNTNQNFEMWYEYTEVDNVIITVTDEPVDIVENQFISQKISLSLFVGKLLLLYFM